MSSAEYSRFLQACQEHKDTMTGHAFRSLLRAQIESWKEELVSAGPDQVLKIQGAIEKTRSLLKKIEREINTENRGKTGGFK